MKSNLRKSAQAAANAIVKQQKSWAERNGFGLDDSGWIVAADAQRNLVLPMLDQDRASFSSGAGNELTGKMRAPHSSSALAYNVLSVARSSTPCMNALTRLLASGTSTTMVNPGIAFECKRPTGWRGIPPHLDGEIFDGTSLIAVESKMTESFGAKKSARASLAPYLEAQEDSPKWEGLKQLRDAASSLAEKDDFEGLLDGPQLIKHALGLLRAKGENKIQGLTLVLLWFNAAEFSEEATIACDAIVHEFEQLRDALLDTISLKAITHQQVIRAYQTAAGNTDEVIWLANRYVTPA